MKQVKPQKVLQPVVCPAAQRKDRKAPGDVPCPDHESLETAYRWREEHIQ